MPSIPVRVAIEQSLESLPSIQAILESQVPDIQVTVSRRADVMLESPDIVLLDLDSDTRGLVEQLSKWRRAARRAKVLLMTSDTTAPYCEEAVIHGANGVIGTSAATPMLFKAFACVARGELWLDRQTTGRVFDRLSRAMVRKRQRPKDAALC